MDLFEETDCASPTHLQIVSANQTYRCKIYFTPIHEEITIFWTSLVPS